MVKYFYDKEADVFYFSDGVARASDKTIEAGNDILLRMNPRSKKVRGFTILNASRRSKNEKTAVSLPFSLTATV